MLVTNDHTQAITSVRSSHDTCIVSGKYKLQFRLNIRRFYVTNTRRNTPDGLTDALLTPQANCSASSQL